MAGFNRPRLTLARRDVLTAFLAASLVHQPIIAHCATPSFRRAILGHRFAEGDALYDVADVISPHPEDLMPGARAFAGQARSIMADCLGGFAEVPTSALGTPDRWGVQSAMLSPRADSDGALAALLLARGAARVFPTTENTARITRFLAIEQSARERRNGLWNLPFYRVRNANQVDDCRDAIGSIQVLVGRVIEARLGRRRAYINFGSDYREDVTATVPMRVVRQWAKTGFAVESLIGKTIRVRGYLEWINGPSVSVTHPQMIEVLSGAETVETNAG
ncbi:MAG: hypothetical protein AAFY13_01125 [Pseudomonadota bacterium]